MIKGLPQDKPVEMSDSELGEYIYHDRLDSFEGIEGKYYGISDEIYGLSKLLEATGEMVLKEEREFNEIVKREKANEDYIFPSEAELAVWHKKFFRQFTYRSLIMLIHGTFESGLKKFHTMMVNENQIHDNRKPQEKEKIKGVLDDLAQLDSKFSKYYEKVKPFLFLRNKLEHTGGEFCEGDTNYESFMKFAKKRSDISLVIIGQEGVKKRYKIVVINSAVLQDYLSLAKQILTDLIKSARKRPYSAK